MSPPAQPASIRSIGSHRTPSADPVADHVADLLDVVFAANEAASARRAATSSAPDARAELSSMRPDVLLAGTALWRTRRRTLGEPLPNSSRRTSR